MRRSLVALSAGFAAVVLSTSLQAATLNISKVSRNPTVAEIGAGVPANARIHDFFVTTNSDILSVNQVFLDSHLNLYQNNSFGQGDNEPPNAALIPFAPALAADSWISTPNTSTSVSGGGGGGLNEPRSTTWFDTSNNGPQVAFNFARITTIGGLEGIFSGRITTAVSGGDPDNAPFSFVIPEPSTFVMGGMALVGAFAARRRKSA